MTDKKHLHILWTSADPITADKMVFMYAINAMANGWWDELTLIVWGGSTQLISENEAIQARVQGVIDAGVQVIACKGCADQLGVSEKLESLGIDVRYTGVMLTKLLNGEQPLLTI